MEDIKYWVGLSHFSKFGPVRFKKLIHYFPSMEEAFKASSRELKQAGIDQKTAEEFIKKRSDIDLNIIMEQLEKEKIKILTIQDKNYPKLLKEIHHPPQLLYYKGNLDLNNDFTLAVVGTRKLTSYGSQVTNNIVKELVNQNLTIISGLALGIDTMAHQATLEAGGKTIAVLGTGIDQKSIYPRTNKNLAEKIIENNGAVISEFPPGTQPMPYNFPQRNRIISGLSLGTLVIEAGAKSGALITAFGALEQNREVFAVPGNIYSLVSAGPNNLIKKGARPITSAEEVIESLNLTQTTNCINNKEIIGETPEEEKIIPHLTHEPIHIDELVRLSKLDTSITSSTLTIMEMKGVVKNLGGMQYVLAR